MKRIILVCLASLLVFSACAGPAPEVPPQATSDTVEPTEDMGDSETAQPEPTDEEEPPTDEAPSAEPTANPFAADGPFDVTFETDDGIVLDGTVHGPAASETVVVLAPQYPGEQAGWLPFAEAAADAGLRVVTFDLRGYGESEGERNDLDAPADLTAAVAFAKEQLGAANIVLVGAVQSGTAAALVAGENAAVDGLIVLSAPRTTAADGLTVSDSDLQAISVPSLWIAARQDLLQEVEALHAAAGSSDKTIWIYETSAVPGTELFNGLDSIDLEERLLTFISQF